MEPLYIVVLVVAAYILGHIQGVFFTNQNHSAPRATTDKDVYPDIITYRLTIPFKTDSAKYVRTDERVAFSSDGKEMFLGVLPQRGEKDND